MTRDEANAVFVQMLLDKVRADKYPSSTQMDLIEQSIPPRMIPDYLDIISSAFEGWPGIRSPEAKDYLLKYQVTAEGWYVANPDLTVVETRRLKRDAQALDEFLDQVGS